MKEAPIAIPSVKLWIKSLNKNTIAFFSLFLSINTSIGFFDLDLFFSPTIEWLWPEHTFYS